MPNRKKNATVARPLLEPELRQRLESRFKEADPALFQQTNDFIEDLKAQLKSAWLEKQQQLEAADRWRKQFEQAATVHDERAKENTELKEKLNSRTDLLSALIEALGAEDVEDWENVLLLARGKYFSRGEAIQDHQLTKPKKLIRDQVVAFLKPGESEQITDQVELNKLYVLKVKEELIEIIQSDFKDIKEFADLVQVALTFAKVNGFAPAEVREVMQDKILSKGNFSNIALNNLNPNNPSNYLYFKPTNL